MNVLKTLFKYLTGQQFTLYMDGGGGGGGSGTGTQTSISELPEWARGYAKDTLEKGAALSEKPYQTYDRDRIAGFSPMQQQAQQGAANMQTNQGTGMGMGVAGAAALGGLNQDYNGMMARSQNFGGRSAAQYMNPYVEQSMQPQLREAQRSSDIMGQQNAAKAVGQGAFGGSRSGLVEAERQRNLAMQQGDIRAQGLNTAYNNAQNQFNADQSRNLQAQQMNIGQQQFGANLGLQGLNTALQGANALGSLGGQQFQQGMDINKLQNAYGGQQQALQQQGLSQAYQDFQNQNNYGYKQLGFMSDLIRGMPLGQSTAKSIYEPDPSMAQNLASMGTAAYGLSKFMAEGGMAYADGGEVQGYAGDDGSVVGDIDSEDNISKFVHRLKTDADLQRAGQAAQARGDIDQLEAVQAEMAMRASLRRGIAGGVTNDMAERMAADGGLMDSYAGGGVVAFKSGGLSDYMQNIVDASGEFKPATIADRLAGVKEALPGIQSLYGDSALKPFAEDLKKDREGLGKQKEQGEGLAWLAASKAFLRPGSKSRAVTEAASELGIGLAKANKDFSDANSKLRQSEMTLAAAEQARSDGQIGKAESLYDKGRTEERQATKDKLDANKDLATIQASVDNSIRSTGAQMAQINKPGETERMLADLDAIRTGKKEFQGLTGEEGAKAYQDSVGQLGAARYGVKYTGQNKDFEHRKAVLEMLQKDEGVKIAQMKVAQLEAKEKLTPKEQAALDANNAFLKKRYDAVSTDLQKAGASAGAPAAGGNKNMITMADIQRTAASSGKSVEEVRAAAAAKGYTIQ